MPFPRQKPWLPEQGPADLVFTNAKVIDITGNATLSGCTVHISCGKITAISAGADEKAPTVSGQTFVDLNGKYLMPGLIDCHVHLKATAGGATMRDLFDVHPNTIAYRTVWNAKQMLLRGFTTVRDTSGADFALREAIAEGLVPGPRLFIAGTALSQTGGHGRKICAWPQDHI
jgi:imidazolonepropionase-like amidohydrolase